LNDVVVNEFSAVEIKITIGLPVLSLQNFLNIIHHHKKSKLTSSLI